MAAKSTKEQLNEDFTNQAQATTKEDVEGQDARTRLWQSLDYSYGRQREQSDQSYQKAISQSERSMLQRGMQRSSYGAQVTANLQDQQVKAQNDIAAAQIADYQNRLGQIEQQEAEAERWQKEFDEKQRQYDESMAFQKSEAERSQSNWEVQQAFSEKQWKAQQDQWKQEFNYQKKSDDQKIAYNYLVTMIGQGKEPSSDLIKRAGLSSKDVKAMTQKANSSSGTITWRQTADAAAKKLGFTGRNDPRYQAYLAGQGNPNGNNGDTGGKPRTQSDFISDIQGANGGNPSNGTPSNGNNKGSNDVIVRNGKKLKKQSLPTLK